jgi:D-arabinose 1-dehydrogenase-like Zn-dependent alcohol dehydrogenase
MGATMRVAALPRPGQALVLGTRPVPEPGPGAVRVRVDACGVCGSDLFLQKGGFGPSVPEPVVPGHEAAGTVDALGEGVDDLAVGDQVALYYIATPPGDRWAAAGRPNVSPDLTRMGVDVDGAFAEFVLRPRASVVPVGGSRVPPADLAVLTDAVATPLHALTRVGGLVAGETVIVVGVGGIGSSAVQLAALLGARVIAVSRSPERLALARELGAAAVVRATGEDVVARARDAAGGHGADLVLQCVGSAEVDAQAVAMGGPGGRVVLIGASPDAFSLRAVDLLWRELTVIGSRGHVPADIAAAIELYRSGRLDVSHLTARTRPLEEADEALRDLREGRGLRSVLLP